MLGTVTIKLLLSHFVFRLPFSFVTDDVVQATCQCLLAQASNAENVSLVCCSAKLPRINESHLHFDKYAQRIIICSEVIPWHCATSLTLEGRGKEKQITVRYLPNVHLFIFLRVSHPLHHKFQ